MKIKQLLEGSKPQKIPAAKPRNFVAKNATTSGAGAHKDKKKAAKQGDAKHKNKEFEMGETFTDTVKDLGAKVGDTLANALPKEMRPFDNQTAANFSSNISSKEKTTPTPIAKIKENRNPDLMSQTDYDRYQQSQMDNQKRNFKRDEMEHELGHEDRGMYFVVIAKNGKWEYTKAQPRQEGMNAAQRVINALHAKYPSMHLGMMGPDGKVYNYGKGK